MKGKIDKALEWFLSRECIYKLGHLVYCKVEHLRADKYKADFFCSKWNERRTDKNIRDIYLGTKELILLGNYYYINFPTRKELDKIIRKCEGAYKG